MSSTAHQLVSELGVKRKPMAQIKAARELVNKCTCPATEDWRQEAADAGAIPALLQLLTSPSTPVQEWAVKGLAALAGTGHHAAQVAAAGAVPPLVLLGSTSAGIQEEAAKALKAILGSEGTVAQLISAGALPALVRLLGGGRSEAVQTAGAAALSLMSVHASPAVRDELAAAGVVPALVQLLRGASSKLLQNLALLTLWNAGQGHAANTASMVGAGVVPLLVRCMWQPTSVVQEPAVMLVQLLAASRDHAQALAAAGAIPPLLHLLPSTANLTTLATAAESLSLVYDGRADVQAAVAASDAIPALVQLLRGPSDDAREAAARALLALCADSAGNGAAAVAAGAVAALLPLLDAQGLKVMKAAAELLSCLRAPPADDGVAADSVAVEESARPIAALVRLLASPSEELQAAAAAGLCRLCDDVGARAAAAAAIPSLVQLLSSPSPSTQRQAAQALEAVCDGLPENQVRAIAAGAVDPLLQLASTIWDEGSGACDLAAGAAIRVLKNMHHTDVVVALVAAGTLPLLGEQLGSQYKHGYPCREMVLIKILELAHDETVAAAMQRSAPDLKAPSGAQSGEVAAAVVLASSLFSCIELSKKLDGWVAAGRGDGQRAAAASAPHLAALESGPAMQEAFERLEEEMERFQRCPPPAAPAAAAAPPPAEPASTAGPALLAAVSRWDVAARALLQLAAHHQLGAAQPGERRAGQDCAALGRVRTLLRRLLYCAMTLLAASELRIAALVFRYAFHRPLARGGSNPHDVGCSGILLLLVQLLGSEREAAQRLATAAVLSFSACQQELVDAGAVPALVQLLGSCSAALLPGLVAVLCSLSIETRVQEEVAAAASAVLPHLAKLLDSPSIGRGRGVCSSSDRSVLAEEVQREAAEKLQWEAAVMLRNVCGNTAAKCLVAPAAVPVLVQLLGSASVAVQEQAAAALAGVCYQADNQAVLAMQQAGAVRALVELLASPSPAVQQEAAEALMNIAAHHDAHGGQNMAASAGAIAPLVRLVSSRAEAVQLRACAALLNICCSGDAHQARLVSEGAVPALVRLALFAAPSLREMAAGALRNVFFHSADPAVDQAAAGVIAPLIRLLSSGSAALQEHAAGALRNILFNEGNAGNRALAVKSGALPLLQGLLQSPSAAVQAQARGALENMRRVTASIDR